MAEKKSSKGKSEKKVYQPWINPNRVNELENLREYIDVPIQWMVDEALERYVFDCYNMILEPEVVMDLQDILPAVAEAEWANILADLDQYVGEVTG